MKIKDAHIAYIPSRDVVGAFDVDAVTKKPGLFVDRSDETLNTRSYGRSSKERSARRS